MLPILQYCLLNLGGFLFFLFVWNRLPKPKPLDYTTIPGLKLNIASEEELPDLTLTPGTLVVAAAESAKTAEVRQGHLPEIEKCGGSFTRFLARDHLLFGPLHSFWWSIRYCIVISSIDLLNELRTYSESLLAISPLAIGSILQGDPHFWTRVPACSIVTSARHHTKPSISLDSALQLSLIDRGPFNTDCVESRHESEPDQLRRVVPQIRLSIGIDGKRKALSRPLVVSFNREIELDAHPIPAFIPIILHTAPMVQSWSDDVILDEFCTRFRWLPGMEDISVIKT